LDFGFYLICNPQSAIHNLKTAMPKFKLAPTKSNLLTIKQNLEFAHEGHDLLEQKRQILIAELMALTDRTKSIQNQVDEILKRAYRALEESVTRMGKDALRQAAYAVNIKAVISCSQRGVMGVEVPVVTTRLNDQPPYYSLFGTSFWLDETVTCFKEVLGLIGKLAEARISVLRLAREVKRTIRRVNALEKIFLPDYRDTLKYIEDTLAEQERQSFFAAKLVRQRLKNTAKQSQQ